ncbi:MAG: ATP-binding protein [Bacteroidales bacterium]|nr:ATP-binding protein [Bacteroidales bacterium]MBR4624870.1 ATP-binding protein [Alphaproteobacteria bacterium]
MIITVKNLGVIKKAEFDTSKKLTVFCGPNSTGKTYIAYIIYAIYRNKNIFKLKSFSEAKDAFDKHIKIKIKKEYIDELLSKIADYCKKSIGEIFGISEENENKFFKQFVVNISISNEEYQNIIEKEYYVNWNGESLTLKYNNIDYLNPLNNKIDIQEELLWCLMLKSLIFQDTYMFPVERNSIYTFKTELSLSRNQLLDTILDKKANISKITDLLGQRSRRYPLAIKDNLYIANDLENVQKYKSQLYTFTNELEDELLQGKIVINQNGEVEYKTRNGISLPIGISSSIVKTLSSLIVALKYQVNYGDLLIIDEPEMNLHPDNQVILAKVLAKISNNVRMIVSTHSDYIIRELNNLIVAKSLETRGNRMHEQFYDKESLLDYNNVQVLYFDHGNDEQVSVKSLDVDKYGFAVDSMDETINKQNERMQILFGQMDD